MERALILLIAAVTLFVTPGVKSQFIFSNNTQVNITRTGCGVTKLCLETPDACDPAGNSNCLFGSVVATKVAAPNGADFSFELSGNSKGYVALGLTRNVSEGTTMLFGCAQFNGTFVFATATRDNDNNLLSPEIRNVTDVRGVINGSKIQCEFSVSGLNATHTTRDAHATTFIVLLGTGAVNEINVGPFNPGLTSALLNIANPTSNLAATAATTTAAAKTTASSSETLHSQATLLLLSIVTMTILRMI